MLSFLLMLLFALMYQLTSLYSFDYRDVTIKDNVNDIIYIMESEIYDNTEIYNILNSYLGSILYNEIVDVSDEYDLDRALVGAIAIDCSRKIDSPKVYIRLLMEYSERLKIDPTTLDFVIKHESSRNKLAVNKVSNAVGLIQFVGSTARGLGTDSYRIKKMSYKEQFDLVEKYLLNVKNQYNVNLNNPYTLYLAVFNPSWLNKLETSKLPDKFMRGNENLDMNKDGELSKKEFLQKEKINYTMYLKHLDSLRDSEKVQYLKMIP